MNNQNYHFDNFNNYQELMADNNTSRNLIASYQDVFGDPKLWDESYTENEIQKKLQNELSGKANLRLCRNTTQDNTIMGFCWAQQLGLSGIKSAIESIQFYKDVGSPEIDETLKKTLGDEPALYLHDLGISAPFRGKVSLQQLICPVLNSLAERSNTNRLFFWSIKESRIFKLAQFAGFKLVDTVGEIQFFIGDINSKRVQALCQ